MATRRKKLPTKIRKALIAEAGDKCANPGCANRRTEAHHIREWAIYETHDASIMIAVCPTCHDAIHDGALRITDETLYRWKGIKRSSTIRDAIWVEPAASAKLLLGSFAVQSLNPTSVFELSPANSLSFGVVGEDILLTNLRIASLNGMEVIRVEDNTISHSPNPATEYKRVPGKIEVWVPASDDFLPAWALDQKRFQDSLFAKGDRLKYLGLEVLSPGVLRVEGVWAQDDSVIIITDTALSFCTHSRRAPVSIMGAGLESVLVFEGSLTAGVFGFK